MYKNSSGRIPGFSPILTTRSLVFAVFSEKTPKTTLSLSGWTFRRDSSCEGRSERTAKATEQQIGDESNEPDFG
jgi:hypothetical protein